MERHLIIEELALPPTGEWKPDVSAWTIMRVADGAGYCLQGVLARELNAGDAVIVSPTTNVILRASQLGILRLEFFLVLPQYLNGLLTVTDWRQLESVSKAAPRTLHFPASDLMAQKFSRLAALKQRDGLASRSSLLNLWASAINVLLPANNLAKGSQLRDRFRELVGKMSEAELATRSVSELAAQLHCSERHFSRLFYEEFKTSLRARQTELRLHHASQLLSASKSKIANVAKDSGYRHVGLFNIMFKKQFGMTPSLWRQKMKASALILLLELFGKVCNATEFFQSPTMNQTGG